MIPNDPIEDLFRSEVANNTPLEKPRDMVWNKIEKELPSKKKAPIKDFIQSVWFAAAVFGLIAIPYFYFFVENLNTQTSTNKVIYDIVNHQLESAPVIDDTKREQFPVIQPTLNELKGEELVKNSSPIKSGLPKKDNELIQPTIVDEQSVEISSTNMNASPMSAGSITIKSDSAFFDSKDSLLLASTKVTEVAKKTAISKTMEDSINKLSQIAFVRKDSSLATIQKRNSTTQNKENKLKFYRNKLSYTDKVHKVVFELISKSSNQLIFRNGDLDIKFIKEEDQILFITNSKEIKQEIINAIALKKDQIFDYYIKVK